jgi:5'-deoxynucleotidase YfbR-like HD superfamily hydrolase
VPLEDRPSVDEVLSVMNDLLLQLARTWRTMEIPGAAGRRENVAEHSFFLSGLACMLAPEIDPTLDVGKVAQFAIAHDLVEARAGDVSVWESEEVLRRKRQHEAEALASIQRDFGKTFSWLGSVITDYESQVSPESRFVYALDKVLPHAMVILGDHHPVRPSRDAYEQRRVVAREKVSRFSGLLPYFDELCDIFDRSPHFFADDAVGD